MPHPQSFETRFETLLARAENDIERQQSQLATLRESLTTLEDQIDRQSQDLITLQQLTREAEASRLLYEYFLSRLKETSAQQGVQQADKDTVKAAPDLIRLWSHECMRAFSDGLVSTGDTEVFRGMLAEVIEKNSVLNKYGSDIMAEPNVHTNYANSTTGAESISKDVLVTSP